MALDQERRLFTRNTHMVGVVRGIIETVRRLAAGQAGRHLRLEDLGLTGQRVVEAQRLPGDLVHNVRR